MIENEKTTSAAAAQHLANYCRKALERGPHALDNSEKREILSDPDSMAYLHKAVWGLSDPDISRDWQLPNAGHAFCCGEPAICPLFPALFHRFFP